MPTGEQARAQMHAYVSNEARSGWYDFAAKHGVNVTALLEAAGIALQQLSDAPEKQLPPLLRQIVADARSVASARSSRARPET